MTRYDTAGQTYTQTRRSDPRIAAVIDRALDGMSVANVGAGTGSYEPRSTVIAVEPSTVMLRQRSSRSAPAVQAVAEHIPIASRSVDAALAVLTVHHWTDWRRGVKEMTRIARRRVVIFTVDHSVFERFWLLDDYLPALRETDAQLMGFSTGSFKLGEPSIVPVPVPHDCWDGFGPAYWRRPHAYLDATIRAGISMFDLTPETRLRNGLTRLEADLASGAWATKYADLLEMTELDVGCRLVVAEVNDKCEG
jgi:SAM-dependent methyltransferase